MLEFGESTSIVINAAYESVNELQVTFIVSENFQLVSTLLDEQSAKVFLEPRTLN